MPYLNRGAPVWERQRPSSVSSVSSSSEARTASEQVSSAHWHLCQSQPLQQRHDMWGIFVRRQLQQRLHAFFSCRAVSGRKRSKTQLHSSTKSTKTAGRGGGQYKNRVSFTAEPTRAVRLGNAAVICKLTSTCSNGKPTQWANPAFCCSLVVFYPCFLSPSHYRLCLSCEDWSGLWAP